jgi:YVTN family beta-propeller protein
MNFRVSASESTFSRSIRKFHKCGIGFLASFAFAAISPALSARAETPPQGRLITSLGVAVDPATHKVYAVNENAGTVTVVDEQTDGGQSVKVGDGPIAIAINRVTNRIYVVNTGSGSISVIDGSQDKVIAAVKGEEHPYALAVNEATNKVYVTNTYSNAVTVIDGDTNSAQPLKAGSADGIAIDARTNTIFLTTYEDPDIRIVDGANGAITKVRVGPHLWGMTFDSASNLLYLAHTATADIVALNEKTHEVNTTPVGKIPCAVAINPRTNLAYAVNYGDETVSVVDLAKHKLITTLPVGKHPQAVAIDTARNRVYVANVHGDSVTVIDGKKNAVIGTYPAGGNPYAVAVDLTTGHAYTANYGQPAVSYIDLSKK